MRIYTVYLLLVGLFMITMTAKADDPVGIQNPVLPGFNPDPCIVRVDKDYYIVTSTFEWFPGIPVYHSTDLVNWEPVGHVLDRKSQLDLTGAADADGVYAPSITYHNGLYYVMFTNVQSGLNWALKGYPNYVVTATDPAGPWSEPVYVNSLGFDPSLFIDEDGSAWVLIRVMDHRKGKSSSPGIGIHAFDLKTMKPVGEPRFIYSGWMERSAEGPKMIKKEGYYYLFTAEGGTGYGHYQAVARSRHIEGPYERAPRLFYSSAQTPEAPIQKAGHGTLFTTPDGEWYTTHLGSRPLVPNGNCPLGRETFIQKVRWTKEGWPELENGDLTPQMNVPIHTNTYQAKQETGFNDSFDSPQLSPLWQTLREPVDEDWLRINPEKGILSLRGRHFPGSLFRESLIAQRITSYHQEFETYMEFNPTNYRHTAGLTCYYNTRHFYILGLTYDEEEIVLKRTEADKKYDELYSIKIPKDHSGGLYLKVSIDKYDLQFYYSLDGTEWETIGEVLDFGKISDDYAIGYTGAMVGLFASDQMYEDKWAQFHYFKMTKYSR